VLRSRRLNLPQTKVIDPTPSAPLNQNYPGVLELWIEHIGKMNKDEFGRPNARSSGLKQGCVADYRAMDFSRRLASKSPSENTDRLTR
jgi:hypothetical protein